MKIKDYTEKLEEKFGILGELDDSKLVDLSLELDSIFSANKEDKKENTIIKVGILIYVGGKLGSEKNKLLADLLKYPAIAKDIVYLNNRFGDISNIDSLGMQFLASDVNQKIRNGMDASGKTSICNYVIEKLGDKNEEYANIFNTFKNEEKKNGKQ